MEKTVIVVLLGLFAIGILIYYNKTGDKDKVDMAENPDKAKAFADVGKKPTIDGDDEMKDLCKALQQVAEKYMTVHKVRCDRVRQIPNRCHTSPGGLCQGDHWTDYRVATVAPATATGSTDDSRRVVRCDVQ